MSVRFRPTLIIIEKYKLSKNFNFKLIPIITFYIINYTLKEIKISTNYKQYILINFNIYLPNYIIKYIINAVLPLWGRVSFKGKGFRIKNYKKKKITFNFGRSHWTKLVIKSNNLIFRKIKRQNYLYLFKDYLKYKKFKFLIKNIKPINYYTKRGLRLKKQNIQRRFGKISQVVSSLH